jgi:asparagine synthase (glutamine-hydrolysing)
MCGFAGFLVTPSDFDPGGGPGTAARMCAALRHRGPDEEGLWSDSTAGIALAHRRLSILDLTAAGRQPMVSASGRFVVAYNGEIYNHGALRADLEKTGRAPAWRGHSDTESLLAAIEAWGLAGALERSAGMFALALWDRSERALYLARDRLGEKPLYYGRCGGAFLFGSQLVALAAFPGWQPRIDRDSLALYLRHNYIPAPRTIYAGFSKLRPGTFAVLRGAQSEPQEVVYWSAQRLAGKSPGDLPATLPDAADELERLLRASVAGQMVADVPLGAFLSGGIDSSTVTALMQAQAAAPVKTFSIGFHEGGYDEAPYARAVARHLGTDHTELYVTPAEARDVIPRLPGIYDEPFADSSQIPTYLVSQLARRDVTVALSGDGADELFGGYNRYHLGRRIWQKACIAPRPVRAAISNALLAVRPQSWATVAAPVMALLPERLRHANMGHKLHRLAEVLGAPDFRSLYRMLVSHWTEPALLVLGGNEPPVEFGQDAESPGAARDSVQWMMDCDLVSYLPDDILVKVDRAAMAVSLETRAPFLDHRVVEFASRLPLKFKVQGNASKRILREVLYRYVPRELLERPKMGFGVPIDGWLRGPLRGWAEDLLSESRLRREGYFDPAPIRRKWSEHLSGARNWQYLLWDVLMFQAWLGNGRSDNAAGLGH